MNDHRASQHSRQAVLYICPVVPSAVGNGIEKRAWAHLDALNEVGPVDLVLFLPHVQESGVDAIRPYCRSVRILFVSPAPNMRKYRIPGVTLALRLLSFGQPRRGVVDSEMKNSVRSELGSGGHSLVFCFRLSSFALLETLLPMTKNGPLRRVVDFDDIESRVLERLLDHPEQLLGLEERLLTRIELAEARRAERHALRAADLILVCSGIDADILLRNSPVAIIRVVPNSLPASPALPPPSPATVRLLFLGTMNYHPNEDAALYFCNEILPLIRAEDGGNDIELDIVGRRPSARVRALTFLPGVRVLGEVERVEPSYALSHVVVVPIRYGGGTRIKILEALALGRPVVSTTVGAEGLDLRDGQDILIADTPAEFARCCRRLAADQELRERISESGRARFMALYETRQICTDLILALKKLLCDPPGKAVGPC